MWPFVIIEWKKVHREMWQPPCWFPKMIYILDHMFRYVLLLPSPLYHIKCSVNALRDKWRQINQPFCIWYDAISVNHSILWNDAISDNHSVLWNDAISDNRSLLWNDAISDSNLILWNDAIFDSNSILWNDAISDNHSILWDDAISDNTRYSEMMQYPITTQVLRLPGTYPRSLFHRSVQYA
jgi:hypothetical protein